MSFLLILILRYVRKETYDTHCCIYLFFVVRNLYGSAINLKNATGRKTAATTAPSRRKLHSIHCRCCCCCCCVCCCCCCCRRCGPFLFTVKTFMFFNKFFKFRLLHSFFRFFASIQRIPFSILGLHHRRKHGT